MIKNIFCDLDGTLYRDGISDKDKQAIRDAKEAGIKFNIATGRVIDHSLSIMEDLNLDSYLIVENGSYIYDNKMECFYRGVLSDLSINKIIETYNKFDFIDPKEEVIYFKYDGKVIMPEDGSKAEYLSRGFSIDPTIVTRQVYESKVGNIGVVCTDPEKLAKMIGEFSLALGPDVEVYASSETTLNIVPRGISKFDAIKLVCKREGISLEEASTIGDSANDISMLKNVRYSFAMENSSPAVKSSASFETPSVADAIKMIIDLNAQE